MSKESFVQVAFLVPLPLFTRLFVLFVFRSPLSRTSQRGKERDGGGGERDGRDPVAIDLHGVVTQSAWSTAQGKSYFFPLRTYFSKSFIFKKNLQIRPSILPPSNPQLPTITVQAFFRSRARNICLRISTEVQVRVPFPKKKSPPSYPFPSSLFQQATPQP
ncbi:hypothetical protein IE53DRAFT_108219 [Violaceomyces palustris]|uniref:Uncharacterized protein n=1 Tax=Violaceomyces palustris TaxID=1673888 RepID=A0ACD0P6N0_9BASI|nr:hypothetical protein IE53DRAFT_108219 [Violaceomyces palustris]